MPIFICERQKKNEMVDWLKRSQTKSSIFVMLNSSFIIKILIDMINLRLMTITRLVRSRT
jgi:hypothetical protein